MRDSLSNYKCPLLFILDPGQGLYKSQERTLSRLHIIQLDYRSLF